MKAFIKAITTTIWRLFIATTYIVTTVYCVLRIVMNITLSANIGWTGSTISFKGFMPITLDTSIYLIVIVLMWLIYNEILESWKRKDK